MPLITIKVFEDELTTDQSKKIVEEVTNSVLANTSEKLRPHTWVLIEEVRDHHWGVGGNTLTLDDVRAISSPEPEFAP